LDLPGLVLVGLTRSSVASYKLEGPIGFDGAFFNAGNEISLAKIVIKSGLVYLWELFAN